FCCGGGNGLGIPGKPCGGSRLAAQSSLSRICRSRFRLNLDRGDIRGDVFSFDQLLIEMELQPRRFLGRLFGDGGFFGIAQAGVEPQFVDVDNLAYISAVVVMGLHGAERYAIHMTDKIPFRN
ncbi:MAG: hypothetical protein M3453_13175, partial [Pseudomonadota bacterium]|nr:hypothetical protein [Pseudomonadota bacterium]